LHSLYKSDNGRTHTDVSIIIVKDGDIT
jgi:hypothetical protein